MANENVEKVINKKQRSKKPKNLKNVCFDEEVVPRDMAQEILVKESLAKTEKHNLDGHEATMHSKVKKKRKNRFQEVNNYKSGIPTEEEIKLNNQGAAENSVEDNVKRSKKKKRKAKTLMEHEEVINYDSGKPTEGEIRLNNQDSAENSVEDNVKRSKKKKRKANILVESEEVLAVEEYKPKKKKKKNLEEATTEQDEESNNPTEPKKKESIRERKRKKYAQLLQEKKLKTELALQQKSLNYLSKWKHSRSDWKFEKLRQIWLQQNMYDSSKVPQDFWKVLVDYFSSSKGKAREVMLKAALRIIEGENTEDDETNAKVERARDIIQSLQE